MSKRVIINNPLSNASWNLNQNVKNISLELDADGNVIARPVFLINTAQNPVVASGTIGSVNIQDPSSGHVANVGLPATADAVFLDSDYGLITYGTNWFYNQSAGFSDIQEEATLIATGSATNTTTQILAAVSSKRYRLFSAVIVATVTAGGVTGTFSFGDNSTAFDNILATTSMSSGSSTPLSVAIPVDFGMNGVLQPTSDAEIALVANANINATVTLVYGAAR